jgi:TetR/AcrR family acrAB operon transcriptional repressor
MRRTKEEAEVTRKTLLEAGLKVFSRKGYADTTLDDIAEEAGVTRGAIYHHFGNKAELYNAVLVEGWKRIIPAVERGIAEGSNGLEQLKRSFVYFVKFAVEDDTFRAINELMLFKTPMSEELEEGMEIKRRGMRGGIHNVAEFVRKGIADGSIRPDVNPLDVGIMIITLQNGLVATWLLDPKLFSITERAEAMADIFFSGLAAQ